MIYEEHDCGIKDAHKKADDQHYTQDHPWQHHKCIFLQIQIGIMLVLYIIRLIKFCVKYIHTFT